MRTTKPRAMNHWSRVVAVSALAAAATVGGAGVASAGGPMQIIDNQTALCLGDAGCIRGRSAPDDCSRSAR